MDNQKKGKVVAFVTILAIIGVGVYFILKPSGAKAGSKTGGIDLNKLGGGSGGSGGSRGGSRGGKASSKQQGTIDRLKDLLLGSKQDQKQAEKDKRRAEELKKKAEEKKNKDQSTKGGGGGGGGSTKGGGDKGGSKEGYE